MLVRAGIPENWALLVAVCGSIGLLVWVVKRRERGGVVASVPAGILLSPIAWPGYLAVALVSFHVLPRFANALVLGLSLGWIITRSPWPLVGAILMVETASTMFNPVDRSPPINCGASEIGFSGYFPWPCCFSPRKRWLTNNTSFRSVANCFV
jgi:hypothetical protein